MNINTDKYNRTETEMFLITAMKEYYSIYWGIVKKGPKEAFYLITDKEYMETVYDQVMERAKKRIDKKKRSSIDFEWVRLEVMTIHTKALVLAYM
ncbi:hypothetical protein AVE81_004815 [Salmonella enterica subsp. diarizonae]|nr:hypothetical protein [Salmonella enterica subsp. diarizonae]ECF6072244.1 hypothetical protein [Salmonella enterica subsp. diarizonae]EDW9103846.1 hypothetical protein [Salmonella enterica subsp. diarizonae]